MRVLVRYGAGAELSALLAIGALLTGALEAMEDGAALGAASDEMAVLVAASDEAAALLAVVVAGDDEAAPCAGAALPGASVIEVSGTARPGSTGVTLPLAADGAAGAAELALVLGTGSPCWPAAWFCKALSASSTLLGALD
jgi:hypothetical protein